MLMYVITRAEHGGAQSHVLDLVRSFRQEFSVCVVTGERGFFTDECLAESIPVHVVPALVRNISPWSDVRAFQGLLRLIEREKPDLIHAHTWKAGILGRLAALRHGIPSVYTVHMWHFGPETPVLWRLFGPITERVASRWSERTISVSRWGADVGKRYRIAPESKMVVIHNGISDAPGRSVPGTGKACTIAMVARFTSFKDHEVLVRAFAETDGQANLVLIGGGPTQERVKRLVDSLEIADRVTFTGTRSDVAQLLPTTDIFVLASKSEHLPISILEAMRAGLPVIASKVGGIPELVSHGETGLLVEPSSVTEMRGALNRLIGDSTLRATMGKGGRRRFETRFSLPMMVAHTRAVYHDVLNERRLQRMPPAFHRGQSMEKRIEKRFEWGEHIAPGDRRQAGNLAKHNSSTR